MSKLFIFIFAALAFIASAGKLRTGPQTTLHTGESLRSGTYLRSHNTGFYAYLKKAGNFGVYKNDPNPATVFSDADALWQTYTNLQGQAPWRVTVQSDGNAVLYDAHNVPLWNSQTSGQGAPGHYLIMQDDGNLVLYDGNDIALWDSNGNVQRSRSA